MIYSGYKISKKNSFIMKKPLLLHSEIKIDLAHT